MKTISLYANEHVCFAASEVETLALNLSGLIMSEDNFNDLLKQNELYYTLKDDIVNDLSVNLINGMFGFNKSIVNGIIDKIERLTIPELQQLYSNLYKASDFFKMIEFVDANSKN